MKSKFSAEKIAYILRHVESGTTAVDVCRQVESGTTAVDVCRQHGISEQTFYRWKKLYGA